MSKSFTTAAKRVADEPIEFELDGDTYHFKPPTSVGGLALSWSGYFDENPLKIQLDWLGAGLPDDEEERIKRRLLDTDDNLEVGDLLTVINWILEEMSGRPTTPSSG